MRAAPAGSPAPYRLLAAALALLGFAVRLRGLGAKSLWLDEGLSVDLASNPLRQLLGLLVTQDIHPPLHYVALHGWLAVAGQSEFAARFPALLAGALLVPATYVLARSLFGPRPAAAAPGAAAPAEARGGRASAEATALLAALLAALSPFLVYYAQEARMYSELALWGLLSSLSLWRLTSAPARRWLLAHAITTALALYTHYFAGLVVAFQVVYLAGTALRRPRAAAAGALALAGAAALYAPWLPGAALQLRRLAAQPDFWQGQLSLAFVVEKVFTALALGKSGVPVQSLPLVAAAALLFAGGLLLLARHGLSGRRAEAFVLLNLLVPLLALYAIAARNPKFTERYLIVIAPAFYVVVARGLVGLAGADWAGWLRWPGARWASRALAVALALGTIGASAAELRRVYAGPGYEKDDNRGAIAYIQAHEEPGDVVVLMMGTEHVFQYYYRGSLPRHSLHPGDDVATAAALLNQYLAGRRRLWLLLWQEDWADPTGFVRESLSASLARLPGPGDFRGLKLQLYAIDPAVRFVASAAPQQPLGVNFEDALTLVGYDPPAQPTPAGDAALVTLYWQAQRPLSQDYVVSLRLVGDGYRWSKVDRRPAAYTYPTTSWRVGRPVRGSLALPVPPGAPPGDYDLEVVVYPQETRRDLNVLGADGRRAAPRATIGRLRVARPAVSPDPSRLTIQRPADHRFGSDLRLLGAELGAEAVRAGAGLDLALFWQALGPSRGDDAVRVTLVDAAGQAATLDAGRPAGGRYATSLWQEGELVIDRRHVVVPPATTPGPAQLLVALQRLPEGRPLPTPAGEQVALATIQVGERPRLDQRPSDLQHPLDVRVGDLATLIGYSLRPERTRPGGDLSLVLYWQARGSSEVSYSVFTHLLDATSQIRAQHDGVPAGGANPTTGWLPDEYVRDEYRLQVQPDAPPGDYVLEVGMYDPQTGARLPVYDASGGERGDRIVLQSVAVGR